MRRILLTIFTALTLSLGTGLLTVSFASAASSVDAGKSAACQGIQDATGDNCASGGAGFTGLIKTTVNILSIIVGVAAVIMIIVAALKYVTAGGDSNSISSAKNTLIYALVGLAIAAFAQVLVQWVFNTAAACTSPSASKIAECQP